MKKNRTQQDLARNEMALNQIIQDSDSSLNDDLMTLDQDSDQFINNIYDVSFDEMSEDEQKESVAWIKDKLKEKKEVKIFNNEILIPSGETLSKWQIVSLCQEFGDDFEKLKKELLSNPDDGWTERGVKLFIDFLESEEVDNFLM